MKLRSVAYTALFAAVLPFCLAGCGRKKAPAGPEPFVELISAPTVASGESTTFYGGNFGRMRGSVKIGDSDARVIKWTDSYVRIRVPNLQESIYPVKFELPNGVSVARGSLAVRAPVGDGMYDWADADPAQIDGSNLRPLVMLFCPVGGYRGLKFDYDAPIPRNRNEFIKEVTRACLQGVQIARLYFPATISTGPGSYADFSQDNVREIISQIHTRCPGMMFEIDAANLPPAARAAARMNPAVSFTSIYETGDFSAKNSSGATVSGVTDPEAVNALFQGAEKFHMKPLPVVATVSQAFSISRLAQSGVAFAAPRVFQIYMAHDTRAQDDRKTYDMIYNMLPKKSQAVAVTTAAHVSQITGYAVIKGDHIAFGFQYAKNWPGDSENEIPNNLFVLEKILDASDRIGRPIATFEEAARFFGKPAVPSPSGAAFSAGGISSLPASALKSIALNAAGGEMWVGTSNGAFFSPDGGATFKKAAIAGAQDSEITGLAATDNGAVWLGTRGNGIFKTADRGKSVSGYNAANGILDGDIIGCLYGAGNTVYACTFGAEAGNPGKGIAYTPDAGASWYVITTKEGLPSNDVSAIYFEDEWILAGFGKYSGSDESGSLAFSKDFGVGWTKVGGVDAKVTSIRVWHDNTVLVGTKRGVYTLKLGDNKAVPLKTIPENTKVTFMELDNRGWLWVGTAGGVMVTDDITKTFHALGANEGIGPAAVRGAVCIPPYNMWLATDPGGLIKLQIKAK